MVIAAVLLILAAAVALAMNAGPRGPRQPSRWSRLDDGTQALIILGGAAVAVVLIVAVGS